MGWNSTGHPKAAHEYARKGPESQMVKMITFFQNPAQVDTGGTESRENLFFPEVFDAIFHVRHGCRREKKKPDSHQAVIEGGDAEARTGLGRTAPERAIKSDYLDSFI